MKTNNKTKSVRPELPVVDVTELSVLEQLAEAEPLHVEVEMYGKRVRVLGRRLKPAETKQIQLLLDRALPNVIPATDKDPERYDLRDPKYLEQKEDCRRRARALAVYTAYPVFREAYAAQVTKEGGGATDEDRIVQFIEARSLEDDFLDVLFSAVTERKVEASRYVGFTFGNSSRGA